MPRFAFCIFCTMLAAIAAMLMLFAPAPGVAQDAKPADSVEFGQGETVVGELQCRLLMLGSDAPQAGFKLLAMAKYADGSNTSREILTDKEAKFTIRLRAKPSELRVFAFGDFFIPDGWANIPVANMKFESAETWTLRVRPLRPVKLTGKVTTVPGNKPAQGATLVLAPLDVAPDGSARVFDQPFNSRSDETGAYELEVPSGYYMLWAYWWDRDRDDWPGFIQVMRRVEVFADRTINMALSEAPTIRGRVVDARTGEGVAATIDLFTNQYLSTRGIRTADGHFADEYKPDGTEVKWPVGTFRKQAWQVDPDDITAVIRPSGTHAVLRIIPGLKLADLVDREIVWELFTPDMHVTEIRVATHEHDLPINEVDMQLLPRNVDVPPALRLGLEVGGVSNNEGRVTFAGLPRGEYEVYVAAGSAMIGKVTVGDQPRAWDFKYRIPFAYGAVTLPGGEVCKRMMVFVSMTSAEGRRMGPYPTDPFRNNPTLREAGRVFLPLTQRDTTFRLRFAAFEAGREFKDSEWSRLSDFPLVTDEVEFKVETEKGFEIKLELKPNPDFGKPEKRE